MHDEVRFGSRVRHVLCVVARAMYNEEEGEEEKKKRDQD